MHICTQSKAIFLSKPEQCDQFSLFPGVVLFLCVEVLQLSQPIGIISSTVSLLYHTFPGLA